MSRTKKSIQNMAYAFGVQGITTISSFIIRTIMIKYLGMHIVSLNGLFTEVISALTLAELGVGSAIIYNLYKPLSEGNEKKICQLMMLFKKAYQITALITFTIGLILCPFIHLIINSINYSTNYIRFIYMLFVLQLSVSYLFTYKISLLIADQKNYVSSRFTLISKPIITFVEIIILIVTKSFVAFLVIILLSTIINNKIISYIVDRQYPYLKSKVPSLSLDERKTILSNIKNLFIKTLSGKITTSTDNILISTLVNTVLVGYYSNYAMVIGVFKQIANQISYNGIKASLGNLIVTEDNDRSNQVFYTLTYLFYLIASLSSVCVLVCINPFITSWLGEGYLLGTSIVLISCLNLFVEILTKPLWIILDVSGLFALDKYISIIGSIVNLIVSIILGLYIGIVGIFIGTLFTYLIQATLKVLLLFKKIMKKSAIKYYSMLLCMSLGMILQMLVVTFICSLFEFTNSIVTFIVYGLISSSLVVATNLICTFRTKEFHHLICLLKGALTR